ncbi:MAG: sterol desaturase family protein [Planctomycetaceae bacterium]|nr:sterol desaturase family protein [Planctomycetaceae bacterium]
MQDFIHFFETMPSAYRSGALVLGLVLFWIIEGAVPLFSSGYPRLHHAALNICLTLFQLVLALAFGIFVLQAATYTSEHHFGLLYLIDFPLWLHAILGILLLDLCGGYWIHRFEHRFPLLWRFHIIHHTDKNVDVTTGLRHHPAETIFRLSSQLFAVWVAGIPIGVIFLYQMVSVFFTQWTHANLRVHRRLDHLLSYLFVTPNMHKVHHHHEKPLTDMNYGNVFSIWDRLFGTFVEVDPATLHYGIDSLPDSTDHEKLTRLLLMPFQRRHKTPPTDP